MDQIVKELCVNGEIQIHIDEVNQLFDYIEEMNDEDITIEALRAEIDSGSDKVLIYFA